MIRTLEWKLSLYINGDGELYDLRKDPAELNNLYDEPSVAAVRAELTKDLLIAQMLSEDPRPPSRSRDAGSLEYLDAAPLSEPVAQREERG